MMPVAPVCLDEKPVVLDTDACTSLLIRSWAGRAPGRGVRAAWHRDQIRSGQAPSSWRHAAVTQQRTTQDYAECLRYLLKERYP